MPNYYTHLYISQLVTDSLNIEAKKIIYKNLNSYYLGCQGPDPFFYYNIMPWRNSNNYETIGFTLHSKNSNQFFKSCLHYITIVNKKHRELLLSYFFGYINHYTLDKMTHPYIFYKTGFNVQTVCGYDKYAIFHRKFESTIDYYFMKNTKYNPVYLQNTLKSISKYEVNIIENMLTYAIYNVYGIALPKGILHNSKKNMDRCIKITKNPLGSKKAIDLERRIDKIGLISSSYTYNSIKKLDIFNLQNKMWHDPWDKNSIHTSSFFDLLDQVVVETVEIINIYFYSQDEMLIRLGNDSFETGIDCDARHAFKYFESVYEQI